MNLRFFKKPVVVYSVFFLIGMIVNSNVLLNAIYSMDSKHKVSSVLLDEKKNIIEDGDSLSYNIVVDSMIKADCPGNYFGYSVVMALKYNYTPANYDAYNAMALAIGDVDSMDYNTRNLALFFIKRGAKYGDERCVDLSRKYGLFFDTLDSMYIKFQMEEAEHQPLHFWNM